MDHNTIWRLSPEDLIWKNKFFSLHPLLVHCTAKKTASSSVLIFIIFITFSNIRDMILF